MAPGSRERAKEDALRHGLSRRLREMKKADHAQYVEMECCRIVESLRAIRDEYRRYLKEKGCEPICDMQVSQHYLPHRGFDVLSRIGNSRGEQLCAILSNEVHVFQEKSLAIDRGDRLKVDRGSLPEWPHRATGHQVRRMHLPVRNILAI
jgi:hypothetical protein